MTRSHGSVPTHTDARASSYHRALHQQGAVLSFTRQSWLFAALCVVAALIYGVISYLNADEYDNFIFDYIYRSHNGGNDAFSWQALTAYIAEIRDTDNCRLANILAPICSLMTPRWLFAAATGVAVAAIIGMTALIATDGSPSWRWLAAAWITLVVFLPWRNRIFVGDYTLNYIFPGALSLLLMRSVETRRLLWSVILAVLLGAMHEGFALPLGAGFAAWILLRRFKAGKVMWTAFVVLVATAMAVLLCPGMINRFVHYVGDGGNIRLISQIAVSNALTLILIGTWIMVALAWAAKHSSWAKIIASSPTVVIASVAALAGLALSFMIRSGDRTAFAPSMFAAVALLRMWKLTGWHPSRRPTTAAAVAAIALCVAHGALTIHWQARLHRQFQTALNRIYEAPGATVYLDIIDPLDVSPLTLLWPSYNTFIEPFTYASLMADNRFIGTAVVPTALSGELDPEAGASGKSTNVDHAQYVAAKHFDGRGLTAANGYDPELGIGNFATTISLADGSTKPAHVFFLRFRKNNGEEYYYLRALKSRPEQVKSVAIPH